jgi:hypothetical protein
VDLDNIENLFSTFEMATLVGRLGSLPEDMVNSLPSDLRYLIMRTIESSILFDIDGLAGKIFSPYPYDAFCELLLELNGSPESGPVGVISFNYDLCLEYALARRQKKPFYGINAGVAGRNQIPLFKVHGSLNWFNGNSAGAIEAMDIKLPNTQNYFDRWGLDSKGKRPIDTMELLFGSAKWGEALYPKPIIVPPTWNKGVYQEMLKSIWRHAASALASAENIFVMGYSLPPSDQFFRSFYSLSTISDTMIDRFWVYDPNDSEEVTNRYKSLLGPAIRDRGKFQHKPLRFAKALEDVANAFGFDPSPLEDI